MESFSIKSTPSDRSTHQDLQAIGKTLTMQVPIQTQTCSGKSTSDQSTQNIFSFIVCSIQSCLNLFSSIWNITCCRISCSQSGMIHDQIPWFSVLVFVVVLVYSYATFILPSSPVKPLTMGDKKASMKLFYLKINISQRLQEMLDQPSQDSQSFIVTNFTLQILQWRQWFRSWRNLMPKCQLLPLATLLDLSDSHICGVMIINM